MPDEVYFPPRTEYVGPYPAVAKIESNYFDETDGVVEGAVGYERGCDYYPKQFQPEPYRVIDRFESDGNIIRSDPLTDREREPLKKMRIEGKHYRTDAEKY